MENPWCTYGADWGPEAVGKIITEGKTSVNIQYWEKLKRTYVRIEPWEKAYVKKFPTFIEALNYMLDHYPEFDDRMDSNPTRSDLIEWVAHQWKTEASKYFRFID